MKGIPLSSLVPNTYIDQPVYLDKSYILLTPDSPISPELLKRLVKWKYSQVFTEGKAKDTPSHLTGADQISISPQTIDDDIRENEQVETASRFYNELIDFVSVIQAKFAADGVLNLSEVTEWVKKAIGIVRDHRDFILRHIDVNAESERYLITHAANSTILSLAIGDYLKAPPHRLIELGNASLLHEIGMQKLPEELRRSSKVLNAEERKAMYAHTILGYRILKGFSASDNIALAALEHHERIDGSGYPRNLPGEKITEFARIIGVTCSYDAMVSRRPFRPGSLDGHSSIKDLLQKNRKQYDDRVLKALVYTLSVYPIGTAVMLSNKSVGLVEKTDPSKPRYPIVRILVDPEGKKLADQPLVQTSETKGLNVLRALGPEEARAIREEK